MEIKRGAISPKCTFKSKTVFSVCVSVFWLYSGVPKALQTFSVVVSYQCLCEQLCPVLRGEFECFRLLAAALAECEVELGALALAHRGNATDVPIRPLGTKRKQHITGASHSQSQTHQTDRLQT